ncbi:Uncharacterized protein Rs2_06885 [Raphanus sativus]|nr:Uncharacterized protein Rs2_06885 [Raphanus sativus]
MGVRFFFYEFALAALSDTIIEADSTSAFSGAGEARSRWRRDLPSRLSCLFVSMLFSDLSCMFCLFLILLLRGGWSSHWYSRRRRKQSRMNPLLSVMLPLWLLLLCSATSISCPTMSENCFSSESLEDIYSGTFAQRLLVGFEAASPLRSFLISHQDLSVPVALPGESVGFSFLWSSLWTDLLFHRYVPPSSTLCSTTTLPTGKNFSNLLWRDGKSPSNLALDLAVTEFLCGSAHTDDCSLYISLLDHSDQRLGFGSIKSPQLHHGNAGVGSPCLESTLVPSEFGLKPISLSAGVKKLLPPLLGLLLVSSQDIRSVSVNSYCHELTMCIRRPKLTSLISRHGLGKLERLSLIDLSFLEKFISTSSHRG